MPTCPPAATARQSRMGGQFIQLLQKQVQPVIDRIDEFAEFVKLPLDHSQLERESGISELGCTEELSRVFE